MNSEKIKNKKLIFLLNILIPFAIGLYIIGSLSLIYNQPEKYYFDLVRLFALSSSSIIGIISLRMERWIVFLFLFFISILLLNPTTFMVQIVMGLVLGYIIYKKSLRGTIKYSIRTSLVLIFFIILLSNFGLIESSVVYNNIGDVSGFFLEKKEDFGFWHPNILGSVLAGCLAAAYYLRLKAEYILAIFLILYITLLGSSRTYIVISFLIVFFQAAYNFKMLRGYAILFAWAGVVASIFISLLFIFPDSSTTLLGDSLYYKLDHILSYRLSIARRSILSDIDNEALIDSFYLNLLNNYGLLVVIAMLLALLLVSLRALRLKMYRELVILFVVSLCANFENGLDVRGMLGLVFFISLFYVIDRGRRGRIESMRIF